jgi:hypothetical protein
MPAALASRSAAKSFLVLFFKKELPSFYYAPVPGTKHITPRILLQHSTACPVGLSVRFSTLPGGTGIH